MRTNRQLKIIALEAIVETYKYFIQEQERDYGAAEYEYLADLAKTQKELDLLLEEEMGLIRV